MRLKVGRENSFGVVYIFRIISICAEVSCLSNCLEIVELKIYNSIKFCLCCAMFYLERTGCTREVDMGDDYERNVKTRYGD